MKWVGCIFGSVGALLLAINISISGWGFILFLVSSIAWLLVGVREHEKSLIIMNIVFTVINIIGVARWL